MIPCWYPWLSEPDGFFFSSLCCDPPCPLRSLVNICPQRQMDRGNGQGVQKSNEYEWIWPPSKISFGETDQPYSGWIKGYIVLWKGVEISRVGKGHWVKAKVLRCLISMGKAFQESQVLAELVFMRTGEMGKGDWTFNFLRTMWHSLDNHFDPRCLR